MTFPIPLEQIDRFEANNKHVALIVVGWDEGHSEACSPPCWTALRMTPYSDRKTVWLLRIDGVDGDYHYMTIVDPSAFFSSASASTRKSHPCPKCWHAYTSESALANHLKKGCKETDTQVRVPDKNIPICFEDQSNLKTHLHHTNVTLIQRQ